MRVAGIDKVEISLNSDQFRIKDWSKTGLIIQPQTYVAGEVITNPTYLGKDTKGVPQFGSKAYLNHSDGLYQIGIKQYPSGVRVLLSTNPSKFKHPVDLCTDTDQLSHHMNTVISDLSERGILGDWEGANLYRLDLTKQSMMKNPVSNYAPIFNGLQLKRTKHSATYPDGYGSYTKALGVNIYNKGRELKDKKIQYEYTGDNLLRAELQFKTNKGIIKSMDTANLTDIYGYGFGHLTEAYNSIMRGEVFKGDTLVIQLDLENENQLMENIIENYGSRYISQYEKLVCNQIWQRHGSIDNYIDWLGGWQIKKNGKLNRSVLSKKRKELQRLQHQRAFIFKNDDGGKLYRELYKALCA